jgi:4-hydroxy-4-methyl-2-oxoglutarate aldolase
MNCAVNIGDARVQPGDILRGDADGVVAIPKEHEEEILSAAEEIDRIEAQIRHFVNEGMTLAEARKRLGYHQLQTKR